MTFDAVLAQVLDLLQRQGRVSYRALKRRFDLDDAYLEDLKAEIIKAQRLAIDEDGEVLVWTGDTPPQTQRPTPPTPQPEKPPDPPADQATSLSPPAAGREALEAERRQLTVLFCDLVDSTVLAARLDPEELREVVRAYQDTCAAVIQRFEGHIAQYLGDGLLVYFGYPVAHEDDAQRAVRAGLGMLEALGQLNTRLTQEGLCRADAELAARNPKSGHTDYPISTPTQSRQRGVPLAVRLAIHTGLVVVGEVGGGTRHEQLALGETPNLAARLQGIAAPNTVVVSAATLQLLGGFFACQSLGTPDLKGLAQPIEVYRVLYESTARSRLDVAGSTGLTPLVGREQEVALLQERWEQVKDGVGQVVLLSGEAGIGKSRLLQVLREQVATDPQAWLTPCQCSPYHQNSALYPVIDLLERVVLQFERDETPLQKLSKLEGFLVQYGLPLAESVSLFASLLSIPLGSDYAPLNVSPELQKQKTLQTILTILLRRAAQQPVLFVVEDLHWVDPSTLELLSLLVDQGPTARILTLFPFRPDFPPPWTGRSHLTQITLNRLTRRQVAEMSGRVAHGKALPGEVVEQVVAKTDGVPLFVEELTKMVLESGLLQEREDRYELTGPLPPLAIPATLHDSLMARLDRLAMVKGVAQLGATLGREFSYELLQAVSPLDAAALQQALTRLVEVELLYQRGVLPQATYLFKHALIQEAAYQSLLKSTRQQYHQCIARVLEERFPEVAATQPELLAHHYTEAGLGEEAVAYWQRAGRRALERSAHLETVTHLTKGLEVLETLPEAPQRLQQELDLQTTLGPALSVAKGYAAPEVERSYTRARELCQLVEDAPQLGPVLWGLHRFYLMRAEHRTAQELAEQLLSLSQHTPASPLFLAARAGLASALVFQGELIAARGHLLQEPSLSDAQERRALAFRYGVDPGVIQHIWAAFDLWTLGYPVAALQQSQAMLTLAQELAHPFSLAVALAAAAVMQQCCRDLPGTHARAAAMLTLATEQGFPYFMAWGAIMQGWVLAVQGQAEEGIAQIRQGLAAYRATGAESFRPYMLVLQVEAYGQVGQADEGLRALTDALATVHITGERWWEAELHRLRGQLLLQGPTVQPGEAEACFHQALAVARHQQAKSFELRAAVSLSRLWQRQGKHAEARQLLAEVYGWFTEGFDTVDLQEARALLEELA